MIGPLLGHAGVILPQVDLPVHAFHRQALLLPDRRNIKENIGFPAHLLGSGAARTGKAAAPPAPARRGCAPRPARSSAPRARPASCTCDRCCRGVITAVAHHPVGPHPPDQVDQPEFILLFKVKRVIPKVEAHPASCTPSASAAALRLGPPPPRAAFTSSSVLPSFHSRALSPRSPKEQAGHRHLHPPLRMQRDRAPTAPDEIGGMRRNHQRAFSPRFMCISPCRHRDDTRMPRENANPKRVPSQ